jgi:hypothetical protein
MPEKQGDKSVGENYVQKNGIYLKEDEQKIVTAVNKFLL